MVDTKSYFAISANGNPLSALSYDMYQPNIKVMFNRVDQH